jgi:hypothetical protein
MGAEAIRTSDRTNARVPNDLQIYLLYHVAHSSESEEITHRNPEGDLRIIEEDGDDVRLLGCYSSRERATERILTAALLPGFRDEPDCFMVTKYVLDRDEWPSGFGDE